MKLFRRILTFVAVMLVWGGIVLYLVWATGKGREHRAQARIERISINIADSPRVNIVNGDMVMGWLDADSLNPITGRLVSEVDTRRVVAKVTADPIVAQAKSYVDMNNVLYVSLRQRKPVMRIVSDSGHDFYVTEDRYILPACKYPAQYVPVITGDLKVPFTNGFSGPIEETSEDPAFFSDENYTFFINLINFVDHIRGDDFWNAQIVQINVCRIIADGGNVAGSRAGRRTKEPVVELIPRVGNHTVILGSLDGYQGKLDKLLYFYRNALNKEGWENWSYIDLRFAGQVVCR